ncbi:MAG: hypothetical protein QNK24_16350 [Desulfuromusa sp.]|nr:hypothetical protein [Desulfuromusa sp.]
MENSLLDTHHKALTLNKDRRAYGTIAEIGAGQETARWFFKVGSAAGSIAKTMSAYDMQFSDSIYGSSARYVSRERLHSMLEIEYKLLSQRLDENRCASSVFFVFANTVTTFDYSRNQTGHGWLGIQFQTQPHETVSEIHLHVVLKGSSSMQDQKILGILGVNLIYGAYYMHQEPVALLRSLMDGLASDQLEIDMVDFSGIAFDAVDNRIMALRLVQHGLAHVTMFQPDGKLVQPAEALFKKAVLVERSRFCPPTKLTINLLDSAYEAFCSEANVDSNDVIVFTEMTLCHLRDGDNINVEDFLQRVDILCALGKNVMITNFAQYYRLAQFLFKQTSKPVALALGIPALQEIFKEKYYEHLAGGIMESFGLLFRNDMRMYVCPVLQEDGSLLTVDGLEVETHLQYLYRHLLQNGFLHNLDTIERSHLTIDSNTVREKIRGGDPTWQHLVPPTVVNIIKKKGLFQQDEST